MEETHRHRHTDTRETHTTHTDTHRVGSSGGDRHTQTHRHRETHHLASLGLETGSVGSRSVYEQGRRGGGGGLYCCLLLLRYCGWQRGGQPLLLHLLLQLLHSLHLWEERGRGAERARARDGARERERERRI